MSAWRRQLEGIRGWRRGPAGGAPAATTHHRVAALLVIVAALLALGAAGFARFAVQVHAFHERRAAGPGWSFPSRLYSDGVELVTGRHLPMSFLQRHLDARDYRRTSAPARVPGTWAPSGRGVEIALRGFDDAADPAGHGGPERVRVVIANGSITAVERLGAILGQRPPDLSHPPRLEPVFVAHIDDAQRVRRTWVPLARIPRVVQLAVIASEDRRFRRHMGIDLRSNLRALVTNVGARQVRQGGSTITQQLARALFLTPRRTVGRKLQEALIALGLECLLSKDEILEMYLNSVYWGQGGGVQIDGIAEASRWYFGVPVDSLGLDQAALLAGMIPAPNVYHPLRNPAGARAKRNAVLSDMAETGVISAAIAARAKTHPLGARPGVPERERFPSFTGAVREWLGARLPKQALEQRGLTVLTTMDLVWQDDAERVLPDAITSIERLLGRRQEPLEGAFVAIDPTTGFIRAVVGGRDPGPGTFNRATHALRQPGSAIKPVVYATALDPGRGGPRFTPASTVPDLRREFPTPEGPWSPRNDEGEYHDSVTLAKALAKSLNVATANLVEAVGPGQVVRVAQRFGLPGMKPVASVGLGTNEVTLAALTDAYSTFPNGGVRHPATPVRALPGSGAAAKAGAAPAAVTVLPRETAELMTGLLEDVVIFGVSYPLRSRFGFTRPLGGKTGTTNDYHDAWFVGFTPDVVAGVWVGWDQPQSIGRPAAEIALPVWAAVMDRLIGDFPPTPFAEPSLELSWIDPWSGGRARSDCPSPMRVPFLKGTSPTTMCTRDHTADWARIAAQQASDSTAAAVRDSAARADSVAAATPH